MSAFQMTVELTKLFPVQEIGENAIRHILKIARDLRKSGSDLLIETDLAAIFGRGRICHDMQNQFKQEVLHEVTMVPLCPGSEIDLVYGPGPTVNRAIAMQDPALLSTVIQLSMLAYFHQRTQLTTVLVECISKRFRLGYPRSNSDPGFEGIEDTLKAISAQTTAFAWNKLSFQVRSKLRTAYLGYTSLEMYRHDLSSLHFNQLFAGMDMLCMVQTLPQDRKIHVSNQRGLIPFVVWAHFLLSLTVVVKDFPPGDLQFGEGEPQVIISWDSTLAESQLESHTEVTLLDSTMEVLLGPDTETLNISAIAAEERHALQGYGTNWLRRACNTIVPVPDGHPLYPAIATHATAMAFRLARCLGRDSPTPDTDRITINGNQIVTAAQLLFHGIQIDLSTILNIIERTASYQALKDIPPPTVFESHIARALAHAHVLQGFQSLAIRDLHLGSLVTLILLTSSIYNLKDCTTAPIVSDLTVIASTEMEKMLWNAPSDSESSPIPITEHDFFNTLGILLQGQCWQDDVEESGETIYAKSDFGWSLILDVVGDKDPCDVTPWMMHLRKGVPMDRATEQRKYRMKDFEGYPDDAELPNRAIYDRSERFVPRCVTKVTHRSEYFAARRDTFISTIRFQVHEKTEETMVKTTLFNLPDGRTIRTGLCFREAHRALWGVKRTTGCEHPPNTMDAKLGGEVATANALRWQKEGLEEKDPDMVPERVCVLLVKGDSRARWLALREATLSASRQVILRGRNTCVDCAIDQAVSRSGKWLVVI